MSIKDKKRAEIFEYNYKYIFKEVLRGLRVQSIFSEVEIGIGKNRWDSLCNGATYKNANIEGIIEKTKIKSNILNGHEKMYLYKNSLDDECEKGINIQEVVGSVIDKVKKDNSYVTSNEFKEKYNKEFVKLVQYAVSLSNMNINSSEYKINSIINSIEDIGVDDYLKINSKQLDTYYELIVKHAEAVKAVKTIKSFDK